MRIGIDLMGSDRSPQIIWEAAQEVSRELEGKVDLVLIGREPSGDLSNAMHFVAATEEITMDDSPVTAVRRKPQASLMVGMRLLRDKQLDGFVSAGNTGALIAASALTLPLLPQISRPALLASLPTLKGSVAVVDIGGNVVVRPHHLLEFAQMGVAYQKCEEGIDKPRVGLLNIGTESRKGTAGIREAYDLLKRQSDGYEFIGNVEGRQAFTGAVDVLVCDGFSGNVFLKTAEGISAFIFDSLEEAFGDTLTSGGKEALVQLNRRVNYAEYPGALICGVHGVVIKCHGFSSSHALRNGIRGAYRLIEQQFVDRLAKMLS